MVAKCKSIKEAFSFPITSVPLSISNPDGTLYLFEKSRFRNNLISTSIMDKYAYNAIWIVDAMYAIHMFKPMDTSVNICRTTEMDVPGEIYQTCFFSNYNR